MHDDETLLCPFPERREVVLELSTLCSVRIGPEAEIYTLAQTLSQQAKFSAKDILHVACAAYAKASFFITCDDALMRQARKLNLTFQVLNPVDYIWREQL